MNKIKTPVYMNKIKKAVYEWTVCELRDCLEALEQLPIPNERDVDVLLPKMEALRRVADRVVAATVDGVPTADHDYVEETVVVAYQR
jgi:hypothetical protein